MTRMLGASLLLLLLGKAHGELLAAPVNPFGWDEIDSDGTSSVKLYLKGHPTHDLGVHVVNEVGSIMRPNEASGFYEPTSRRLFSRLHQIEYIEGEDNTTESMLLPPPSTEDMHCEGLGQTPWCPNNQPVLTQRNSGAISGRSAPTGALRLLVLLIQFKDHVGRELPPKEDIETFFNLRYDDERVAKTGSVYKFFKHQSFGKLEVEATVTEWTTVDGNEGDYSFGNYGLTSKFADVSFPVLSKLDSQGFDWSRFDRDSDGILDAVVIMHSGYAAEGGQTDCVNQRPWGKHRIWSHQSRTNGWASESSPQYKIGLYTAISAKFGACGNNLARIGVVGHELTHLFGLPDMIGREGSGVGHYDTMGQMWGPRGDQYYPSTLSAWSREKLGWLDPKRITEPGTYEVRTAQIFPDAYRIDRGFPEGEYLLLENRQAVGIDLGRDPGIYIWHIVDEAPNENRGWLLNPGWPGQPGWPSNSNYYQVAFVGADGEYDLERGNNYGDSDDAWKDGKILGVGPATSVSQDFEKYPNTDSYMYGTIKRTGIVLSAFSSPGETMSFQVSFDGNPLDDSSATPLPTSSLTMAPTPSPTPGPTEEPTPEPTPQPTQQPSQQPIRDDASKRTGEPTPEPTFHPTPQPTQAPTPTPRPTTEVPSIGPTQYPTYVPSSNPSSTPSMALSISPSGGPTVDPSTRPSSLPSLAPTRVPSLLPSMLPSASYFPTHVPSSFPTVTSSISPTLSSVPSEVPSHIPSSEPSKTFMPSVQPTQIPSHSPSTVPSMSAAPSSFPTAFPSISNAPSEFPTDLPSLQPSSHPTESAVPSVTPSGLPSSSPSVSNSPSANPSDIPTEGPSISPTGVPSAVPSSSIAPSMAPTRTPSTSPSLAPTSQPSDWPTMMPSLSSAPSIDPSTVPSGTPSTSFSPSDTPSTVPSSSVSPSALPTNVPSAGPSLSPTSQPSASPTTTPSLSSAPSEVPSTMPSEGPSASAFPSKLPSQEPSRMPSSEPSSTPTGEPSSNPTGQPSTSAPPSNVPSVQPSASAGPSASPTTTPTIAPSEYDPYQHVAGLGYLANVNLTEFNV